LAPNEACSFQGEDHLVDGWRRHAEVSLRGADGGGDGTGAHGGSEQVAVAFCR